MPAVINNSVVKLKGMRGAKKTDKLHKTHTGFFRSYLWMSRRWRRTVFSSSVTFCFSCFLKVFTGRTGHNHDRFTYVSWHRICRFLTYCKKFTDVSDHPVLGLTWYQIQTQIYSATPKKGASETERQSAKN